jgi:hypothetical protein
MRGFCFLGDLFGGYQSFLRGNPLIGGFKHRLKHERRLRRIPHAASGQSGAIATAESETFGLGTNRMVCHRA